MSQSSATSLVPVLPTLDVTVQERLEQAEERKAQGNTHYKAGDMDAALEAFSTALDTAPPDAQQRAVYHANSAACYMSLQRHKECVASCTEALQIDATYQKAIMRRMVAAEQLDDLDTALKDAQQVLLASAVCKPVALMCTRMRCSQLPRHVAADMSATAPHTCIRWNDT